MSSKLFGPSSREWNPLTLALLTALWIATAANWPLWRALFALPENASGRGALFVLGFAGLIAALTLLLLALAAWRRTIKPVAYSSRTPHIHMKVRQGPRELLTTQVYVAGDPGNERDFLWRRMDAQDRAAVTVPFNKGPDGLRATFAVIIAA